MSRRELKPCGTYGGYQRCNRRPEGACDPCKAANTAYKAHYRRDPALREREREQQRAREAALGILAKLHPDEYRRLYRQEYYRARIPAGEAS